MSSVTDSILNSVVLIVIVLALAVIVTTITLQNMRFGGELESNAFLEEQTNIAIDSFLVSTVSGESIRSLLGRAMLDLRINLSVNETTINLINESEKRLDIMFGKDNYYFELTPVIKGVNLMFVFDISASTESEIEVIKDNLELIQEEIQEFVRSQGTGDEDVSIQIFMLPGPPGRCQSINSLNLPNTECFPLASEIMYDELLEKGWTFPDFGSGSYENWQRLTHYATRDSFAQSDWAAGTAYAALFFENDPFLQNQANINFIFPMSDELTTSSKADECFNLETISEFIVCQLCEDGCTQGSSANTRSQMMIDQTAIILDSLETTSRVFPIFSVECNFRYEAGYNQFSFSENPYINSFIDGAAFSSAEAPEVTWCSQDSCSACEQQESDMDSFCFQNECWATLQNHMAQLAQGSDGEIINVNDVSTIPTQILDSFSETVDAFNFTVGVRDESRERFVHEKIIRLPNGFLNKITLWVYRD